MTHVSSIDAQIISNLNTHLINFKYSDSELNTLALGIIEGLKLAGANAPLLEFAYLTSNVRVMLAGGLLS